MKNLILLIICTITLSANQNINISLEEIEPTKKMKPTEVINPKENKNFIALGISSQNSSNASNGFGLHASVGRKNDVYKIYFSIESLQFSRSLPDSGNIEDIGLDNLSMNYDYTFFNKYNLKPYIGAGIGYAFTYTMDKDFNTLESSNKISTNINTGLLLEVSRNFDFTINYKYLYVNSNIIKDAYGFSYGFEIRF